MTCVPAIWPVAVDMEKASKMEYERAVCLGLSEWVEASQKLTCLEADNQVVYGYAVGVQ